MSLKRPEWKQNNPIDQLIALVASASGDVDNFMDNFVDGGIVTHTSIGRVAKVLEQCQELLRSMPNEAIKWEDLKVRKQR